MGLNEFNKDIKDIKRIIKMNTGSYGQIQSHNSNIKIGPYLSMKY